MKNIDEENINVIPLTHDPNVVETEKKTPKTMPINYKCFVPHEYNSFFKESKTDEMKKSILEIGLQQPIVVVQEGDKYKILVGHTRYKAIKQIIEDPSVENYKYHNKVYTDEIPTIVLKNIDKITEFRILYESNIVQRTYSNKEKRECAEKWAKIIAKEDPKTLPIKNKKKFVSQVAGVSEKTAQNAINKTKGNDTECSETDKFIEKVKAASRLIRNKKITKETKDEKKRIRISLEELEQEIRDIKVKIQV